MYSPSQPHRAEHFAQTLSSNYFVKERQKGQNASIHIFSNLGELLLRNCFTLCESENVEKVVLSLVELVTLHLWTMSQCKLLFGYEASLI